jgi:hypothetical protein
MFKPFVLPFLCVPAIAFAQPVPPPVQQPLQIKVTVKVGTETRTHDVAVFDNGCNRVEEKTAAYEDDINICMRPSQQGVFVEVSWRTRNGNTEYRTTSGTVVARKGGKFEVGRAGSARFGLQVL